MRIWNDPTRFESLCPWKAKNKTPSLLCDLKLRTDMTRTRHKLPLTASEFPHLLGRSQNQEV